MNGLIRLHKNYNEFVNYTLNEIVSKIILIIKIFYLCKMDLGSQLSKMFGDHKNVSIVKEKNDTNSNHYRSSTTNSYNKCIDELASNFPSEIRDIAKRAIDKHDQNSFDETVSLGEIYKYNADTGEKYCAGNSVLRIKGEYAFKWFAHCKTVEMWIELRN